MKHVKLLITLALACMLAVPAFAMPMVGDNERGDMFGQLDLTEEDMANMTLAELKEMAEEATTEASDRPLFMGDICLLVTELTVEDVEGMTLAEIEELKESLAEELGGMTIAEIEELREERAAEMEEMTLAELNEHREVLSLLGLDGLQKNQFGMGGPNGFQGSQGNNFRMAGTCTQQQQCIATGFMNGPGFDTQGPRM